MWFSIKYYHPVPSMQGVATFSANAGKKTNYSNPSILRLENQILTIVQDFEAFANELSQLKIHSGAG